MDWIQGFVLATLLTVLSAQVQYTTEDYAMWMRIAARAGDLNFVEQILNARLVPVDHADPNGYTSLHWAARFGRYNVAGLLIDYNADITVSSVTGETAFMSAAISNSVDIGQLLLDEGAGINKQERQGFSPLILAARFGHTDFTTFLLEKNASLELQSVQGFTALLMASYYGFEETVQKLIDGGANLDAADIEGYTGLIWASRNGHISTVDALLSGEADVDLMTNTGDTALMWAAAGNHLEIAQNLYDHDAALNVQEDDGWTALMGASVQGHEEMVELLLSFNVTSDVTNNRGHTALTLSSAMGHEDITDILSDDDVTLINHQDNKQMTPLVHAAANNFSIVFKVIAYKCPDISIPDNTGKIAMDYAVEHNNLAVIKLLILMGDPTCLRFGIKYKERDIVHQDCELLQCHCTSVWRFTGEKDKNCGLGKKQIMTMQRAKSPILNERAISNIVR